MKTLYLECNMGAAGDMLMAALLELHNNPAEFLNRLNNIGIPNVIVSAESSVKCGITGTRVKVVINGQEEESHDHGHSHGEHHHHEHSHDEHDHHHDHNHEHSHDEHHHHGHDRVHDHVHDHHHEHGDHDHGSYHGIEHLIGHLNVSANIQNNALAVYKLIAEAESHAHGVPVDKIHFHEVGEMDAIADIIGVCMLMEELAPDTVMASPVNTGSGHVHCAHGVLPVPAPATAHILQNVPMYSDQTNGELCTPTGAAILKHFVKEFCTMPVMATTKIGYGMGKKEFAKANCVRAFIGSTSGNNEEVTELVCNLDDMTPEAVSFAQQLLLDAGALDAWTTPIGMKKGRAALSLSCMCHSEIKDKLVSLMFKHTSTLGIRENTCRRYTLHREETTAQTPYGTVRIKTASGFGVKKSKPEYDDVVKIAQERGIAIQDVLKEIQ
jgi:uncharacterized protein (TIGR00299 family) protein